MLVFQRFFGGKIRGTFRGKFNRAPAGNGFLIHFAPSVAGIEGHDHPANSIVPPIMPLIVPPQTGHLTALTSGSDSDSRKSSKPNE